MERLTLLKKLHGPYKLDFSSLTMKPIESKLQHLHLQEASLLSLDL